MELYSWVEVIKKFDDLYHIAKEKNFKPSDGSNLFDFITFNMLLRGAGNHIGYKFPEDLKAFRSFLSKLKKEKSKNNKVYINPIKAETDFNNNKKRIFKKLRKTKVELEPEIPFPGMVSRFKENFFKINMDKTESFASLEEEVKQLNLNPD